MSHCIINKKIFGLRRPNVSPYLGYDITPGSINKKKEQPGHTHEEAQENMPTEDRGVCFTGEEYARHVREYWRGVAESDVILLSSSSSCLENFHDCDTC